MSPIHALVTPLYWVKRPKVAFLSRANQWVGRTERPSRTSVRAANGQLQRLHQGNRDATRRRHTNANYLLIQALEELGFTQRAGVASKIVEMDPPAGWDTQTGPLHLSRPDVGNAWYPYEHVE